MNTRHLTLPTAALVAALTLSACGSNATATGTTPAPSGAHGGGHGGTSSAPAAPAAPAAVSNDADVSFLTGMKPHHQQAVEMSEIVLTTNPPADVAAIARQIKAAQGPEIEQIDRMLTDLGQPTDAAPRGGKHSAGHGSMMSEADMAELRGARRIEASLLYLEGMVEHHEGAIEAAEAELRDGTYEPARQLAASIAQDQAAEITRMKALLSSL